MVFEFSTAHEKLKGLETQGTLTDMFVTVSSTAHRFLGIVQVEHLEVVQPCGGVEILEHLSAFRFG